MSIRPVAIIAILLVIFAGFALFLLPRAAAVNMSPATVREDAATVQSNDVSLLFLGDMMFDRGIRVQAKAHGFEYVFGPATSTIAAHDVTIANLEGPITSNSSKTVTADGKAIPGFQFTFPFGTAEAIHAAGIDIVSLANNHTLNFGQAGVDETRRQLTAAGVQYFGSPSNSSTIATTTCVTKAAQEKICIGIIGWHEFAHQNNSSVLAAIKELRPKVDYLVVFPHWGIEYQATSTAEQRLFAHQWIDQGADAVIGSHPHVAETIEQYRGRPIFYSLGNFVFDQYFSFETTHGIGVSVALRKNGTSTVASYTLLPFSSVGSRVGFSDASSTQKLFDEIKKSSSQNISSWLTFKSW